MKKRKFTVYASTDYTTKGSDGYYHYLGLPDVIYLPGGMSSFPFLVYNRRKYYIEDVEDCIWNNYLEDCEEAGIEPADSESDEEFTKYLLNNTDQVYEYLDNLERYNAGKPVDIPPEYDLAKQIEDYNKKWDPETAQKRKQEMIDTIAKDAEPRVNESLNKILDDTKDRLGIKTSKRIKHKHPVMAGPSPQLHISVFDYDVDKDSYKLRKLSDSEFVVTATGTITIESIGTYYTGDSVDETFPCTIEYNYVPYTESSYDDFNDDPVKYIYEWIEQDGYEDVLEGTTSLDLYPVITGRNSFSPINFDGEIPLEISESYHFDGVVTFKLKNQEDIDYLNAVAHYEYER